MKASFSEEWNGFRFADYLVITLVVGLVALTWYEHQQRLIDAESVISDSGARTYRNTKERIYAVAANDKNLRNSPLFQSLPQLRDLESLSLSRSSFADDSLCSLPKLRLLRSLSLLDTKVSDDSLTHIGECRKLEVLSLGGTKVTSYGLRELAKLDRLECLTLARTRVDDSIVSLVASLPNLKELDLRGTKVSYNAIQELGEQLPNCHINYDKPKRLQRRYRRIRSRVPTGVAVRIGDTSFAESTAV